MPDSVIGADRVLAQVDEADVRQVEGGEVVRVETRPLGGERMVGRAERFGGLGIAHDRADLVPDEVGDDLVGRRVEQDVVEHADDPEQLAGGPCGFEMLAAFLVRQLQGAELDRVAGNAAARPLRPLAVRVAVGVERFERVGRDRTVVGRDREVRRSLEHGELSGLLGDDRDRLDARRPGADDGHPLAREVDALVGPPAGEVDRTGEPVAALDVGRLRQ